MTRKFSQFTLESAPPNVSSFLVGYRQGASLDSQWPFSLVGRIKLTADTNFYVATTGSDVPGNGSIGAPWATAQYAANQLASNYDLNNFFATINLGVGTFGSVLMPSFVGGGTVYFLGAGSASSTVGPFAVNTVSQTAIAINAVTIPGISANIATGYPGTFVVLGDPNTFTGADIAFNPCGSFATISCQASSRVSVASGTLTLTGNSFYAFVLTGQSLITDRGSWTLNGTPAYSQAFLYASDEAHYDKLTGSFSGAATGIRFQITQNSDVDCPADLNFFPGNVAGTVDGSSSYAAQSFATNISGLPTTGNLLGGAWNLFKDTSAGGTVSLAYNDGGTIDIIGRVKLLTDPIFYVATTGSDTTGDGSVGNPWATPQFAANSIATKFDINNRTVTIRMGSGTYAGILVPAFAGAGTVLFMGAAGWTTGTTTWTDNITSGGLETVAVYYNTEAVARFDSIQITNSGGSLFLVANYFYTPMAFGNLEFVINNAGTKFAILTDTGTELFGSITVTVTAGNVTSTPFWIDGGGQIVDNSALSIPGSPTLPLGLCLLTNNSRFIAGNNPYTASLFTGPECTARASSSVFNIPNNATLGGSLPPDIDNTSSWGGSGGSNGGNISDPAYPFVQKIVGLPTTTQLGLSGMWGVFKDTSGGGIYVAANDGGSIKKVQLT